MEVRAAFKRERPPDSADKDACSMSWSKSAPSYARIICMIMLNIDDFFTVDPRLCEQSCCCRGVFTLQV